MSDAKPKKKVTPRQVTNTKKGSLVKVVVSNDSGKWVSPAKDAEFFIDAQAKFPQIRFEIDTQQPAPFTWNWTLQWDAKVSGLRESAKRGSKLKTFKETGSFESSDKFWVASLDKVLGGTLTVEVKAGTETFRRSAKIKGKNPAQADVEALLTTLQDTDGFSKILAQESRFKNFIDADGEPIVAFDHGYGMTQMTNPAPSYEQVWNWKENVKGGVSLYQQKQKAAKTYLGQAGRSYTAEQLRLETWSRWNGGGYHQWDAKSNAWLRNDDMLCDSKTGNIGWDMTEASNAGKTEDQLHKRDEASYGNPKKNKGAANKWKYTGICYADHLNEK